MNTLAIFSFLIFLNLNGTFGFCPPTKQNDSNSYPVRSDIYNSSFNECGCNLKNTSVVCVRKCCKLDYVLINKTCVYNDTAGLKIPLYKNSQLVNNSAIDFQFVTGMVECEEDFQPVIDDAEVYRLENDGRLLEKDVDIDYNPDQYCLEYLQDFGQSALVCIRSNKNQETARKLNSVGMIISLPFLLITFLVHAILPDRNLYGLCLMCYVSALFLAYLLLVIISLHPNVLAHCTCKTLGTFCFFFFMVSFFWMNVISIDIYWTFSGSRGFSENKKEEQRKRFAVYGCYAWGLPALLVVLLLCLGTKGHSLRWYYPGIGDGQCWLRDGYPALLYFYGPIAVLLIINVILFVITAWKIKRVQQDTAVLRTDENKRHCHENNRKSFGVYLKLLLIMGLNWSFEIISWAINWRIGGVPPAVWYLGDFINASYGVIIFFIFVFNKSIWKALKKRCFMVMRRSYLPSSTS